MHDNNDLKSYINNFSFINAGLPFDAIDLP